MLTDLLFIYNLENTVQTDHEVKKVLDRIGLEKYHVRFAQEEISYMTFLDIKDEHLREMKIPIGPRLEIIKEIQRIKKQENALGKKINLTFLNV